MALQVLALNCTLKPAASDKPSSTEHLLKQILRQFEMTGAATEMIRVADHDVKAGVTADEGKGDAWPEIRKKVLATDILVLGTPIWVGQPSSICKRVIERLNAFLGETDDSGRMPTYNHIACVAVVGNEDGAHHVSAELFQALNDVGFSLPPNAVAYWVGEAMQHRNYIDLPKTPDKVASTIETMVRNCSHMARLLEASAYPGRT